MQDGRVDLREVARLHMEPGGDVALRAVDHIGEVCNNISRRIGIPDNVCATQGHELHIG